jgi:hypothetical protein
MIYLMKIKFDKNNVDSYDNIYSFDSIDERNLFLRDLIKLCQNVDDIKASLEKSRTRAKNELLYVNILNS